ncbi:hypothetical protein K2173_022947 [Erythroxylum novogranatense]|uniref:DUF4283 domain-containing protein n=1 Tax=Erythroxylum novogranatense TaxID=1862640 RepID=A0AAV8T9F7_9ROSI|nr:hypothetical protein K2173_022947 [Erythroxylum novogranatense]
MQQCLASLFSQQERKFWSAKLLLFCKMDQGLQNLSIREKEDAEFVIPTEEIQGEAINYDICLYSKLIRERVINAKAMEQMLLSFWHPMRGAYIKPLIDNNIYIIQFYHHIDLKKMLAGGPWSFNKCIMLIHQWKEGKNPMDIDFTHIDVWVQFHGLPMGFASETLARNIGNVMGTYLDYNSTFRRNSWNNYMRVRAQINVEEPLIRKKIIRKQGAEPTVITFNYERLPLICYLYGIIGHTETNCRKLLERSEEEISREWTGGISAR